MPASLFSHSGYTVAYACQGQGEPMFLLHGNTGASRMLEAERDYYSTSFRVITMDFIGHGDSQRVDKWPEDFWRANARIAAALAERLACEPAHVVGTSGGGIVALNMALECPVRVRTVVADSFAGGRLRVSQVQAIASQREEAKSGPARRFWEAMHGADWERVVDADTGMLLAFARSGGEYFPRGLPNVQCPVLLTASLGDELIHDIRGMVLELAAQIPNVETEVFEAGGHPAMLSNAAASRNRVMRFIRERGQP